MGERSLSDVVSRVGASIAQAVDTFEPAVLSREEGTVVHAADGVLRIAGVPSAALDEVLEIGGGAPALVLGLASRMVQAVTLDAATSVHEGDSVRLTGRVASIAAGDGLLGRVIDPLGRPLDGRPIHGALVNVPVERHAPGIHQRAPVHAPLYTGTLAIDAMLPIGRGQRELIVGDEGTGKTAIARDAMLRQKNTDVVCVYCAIGRRRAETWGVAEALRRGGGRWIIVSAPEDASAGLRYLAPYAATAVAEYLMYRGEHALIIHDDLSSHAIAWRELSLLLRRPPGREAYPGDVFYLHARLLERAAQLSAELGGGSLTAVPLATLEGGRLSGYIPTNLVSITDGQIVLSSVASKILEHGRGARVLVMHPVSEGSTMNIVPLIAARALVERAPETYSPLGQVVEAVVVEAMKGRLAVAAAEALRAEIQARITAADAARRACEQRLLELESFWHLGRRETITRELLEIVAGREAASSFGTGKEA